MAMEFLGRGKHAEHLLLLARRALRLVEYLERSEEMMEWRE